MPFASALSFLHNLILTGSFGREILTNVRENGILIAGLRKLQALHEKQRKKEGIEKVYGRQQRPFMGSHIFCLVYYH